MSKQQIMRSVERLSSLLDQEEDNMLGGYRRKSMMYGSARLAGARLGGVRLSGRGVIGGAVIGAAKLKPGVQNFKDWFDETYPPDIYSTERLKTLDTAYKSRTALMNAPSTRDEYAQYRNAQNDPIRSRGSKEPGAVEQRKGVLSIKYRLPGSDRKISLFSKNALMTLVQDRYSDEELKAIVDKRKKDLTKKHGRVTFMAAS